MSTLTREQRDILKAAHKRPLSEKDLGANLVEAIQMVGTGLLTAQPSGFVLTLEGSRAIGKRLKQKPGALARAAMANLEDLVPAAVGLIQQLQKDEATGDESKDSQTAMVILMTLCVAVGILARVLGVSAGECLNAIAVGRRVKLVDGPGGGQEPDAG